jgi:hypothetical protein
MYLSKSTLRIKIRRTVKQLETILVLERKKEKRKKERKKDKEKRKKRKKRKKKNEKTKKEGCT